LDIAKGFSDFLKIFKRLHYKEQSFKFNLCVRVVVRVCVCEKVFGRNKLVTPVTNLCVRVVVRVCVCEKVFGRNKLVTPVTNNYEVKGEAIRNI
jgi:hypothetical protein